jgi:hypothetical protein
LSGTLEFNQHITVEESPLLNPQFDEKGRYFLRDYERRRICLYQDTWEVKTNKPERSWSVFHNFDKVEETLKKPDHIIKSTKNEDSKLYHKWYDQFNIREGITTTFGQYMVVIVVNDRKIQTIYTSLTLKKGERIGP